MPHQLATSYSQEKKLMRVEFDRFFSKFHAHHRITVNRNENIFFSSRVECRLNFCKFHAQYLYCIQKQKQIFSVGVEHRLSVTVQYYKQYITAPRNKNIFFFLGDRVPIEFLIKTMNIVIHLKIKKVEFNDKNAQGIL